MDRAGLLANIANSAAAIYQGRKWPKDAFHFACSGHKARFDNSLRSPSVTDNEKNLLKQRYANIVTAQLVYLKKQKKILGEK